MSKFKVSELFYSLQGEGKFVGVPSVFVRLFGCNFTCAGFGMPPGEKSTERLEVVPGDYEEYSQLPLVKTGCDSYPSWDPRFKKFSPMWTTKQLVEKIVDLLPDGEFGSDVHLILTGGEPLLNWQKGFPELFDELKEFGLSNVTFETNGSKPLCGELADYIMTDNDVDYLFSVSAKLPVSGEKWEEAIKPDILEEYVDACGYQESCVVLKFVVADPKDIVDVERAAKEFQSAFTSYEIPVYLMPVGGTETSYFLNNQKVADMALRKGYRYSPRLQVDLWKNGWAT